MVGFCNSLGMGFSLVVARAYGMKDEKRLRRSVAGSVMIGLITVAVLTVLLSAGMRPLLRLLNTPAGILEEAWSYIHVITSCLLVMFAYNLFSSLLRAIGNSLMPLVFLFVSSALNVWLDILFITCFRMGVRGAAVATVIAQGISAVLCFFYIIRRVKLLIPGKGDFRPDARLMKELAGQGFAMAFMGSIVNIGTVTLQSGINSLGEEIIGGHVAARKIFSLFTLPLYSMSLSISTFVSQNFGAGNKARIRESVRDTWIYSAAVGALEILVITAAAGPMLHVISGSDNPVILENGARYLHFAALFFPVLGILVCTRNVLQGMGMKIIPLISSGIEFLGKIVFTAVFVPRFGYNAVIVCEPLIWCAMAAQLILSYRKRIRAYAPGKNNSRTDTQDLIPGIPHHGGNQGENGYGETSDLSRGK